MSNNNSSNLKAITLTIIFEISALNRDEKLGGNIPSIKKLTRFGTKTFSYLSRVAMRHYLFDTLSRNYGGDWAPAECFESGSGNNKVVQFDLRKQNIITSAELDAFGYMFTIGGQQSITRKAPVGITKAIALEPWEGDMQFNANHDLARRCGADPNPVNKEEHESLFKVSFTIDVEKLGYDEWWISDCEYHKETKQLSLFLSDQRNEVVLKDVKEIEKKGQYIIGNKATINIEGSLCEVSKEIMEEKTEKSKNQEEKKYISFKNDFIENSVKGEEEDEQGDKKGKDKKKNKNKSFKIYEEQYNVNEENKSYRLNIGKYYYDEKNKKLTLSFVLIHTIKNVEKQDDKYILNNSQGKKLGEIEIKTINSKKKTIFKLDKSKKEERICQILEVLKNGLIYHSSGENYGIVPLFIIAAGLKLPIPLFNSFVELGSFENSVLNNVYINSNSEGAKKLVYIYNPKNLVGDIDFSNLYSDWNEFLKEIGLKNEQEGTKNQNPST